MRQTLLRLILNPLRKNCKFYLTKIIEKFTKLVNQTQINVFCTVNLQIFGQLIHRVVELKHVILK